MGNKLTILFVFLGALSFAQSAEKIIVGSGPEDLLLDTLHQAERLIISCDERRDKDSIIQGNIWELNLKTNQKQILPRANEPQNFEFNPHGISLLKTKQAKYLFVVNHYDVYKESEIIRYLLTPDSLIYEKRFPYTSSINSVLALAKNHFIITNDVLLRGKVIEYKNDTYHTIDKNIKYPNGVNIMDSVVYVSTVISSEIYGYKMQPNGTYKKLGSVGKVKGADNLRLYNNKLITTSHPRFRKFLKHLKNKKNISPSEVWEINPFTKQTKLLYQNNGEEISAASTGLIYKNHLYISQVFENFILKIKF